MERKKVPNIVGVSLDEAKEILEKANIEIEKEKKKIDIFEKSGTVVKVEPKEETSLKKNEKVVLYVSDRKPILLIILLFLLCALFMIVRKGTISTLINTTSPVIESKTHEWTKTGMVVVTKDAKMIDELKNYEYCVTNKKSTIGCNWQITETKNAEIVASGKWYVYFRGIDVRGRRSKVSNREYVNVDNENPIIKSINFKDGKVQINAVDKHSGIDKIYYSYDGNEYKEAKKSFEYDKSQKILYIKVVDKAGNEVTLSKNIDENSNCDLNCDTNNDGKCDLNCDTDGDGKCDLNCDTNNDGKCDLNCEQENQTTSNSSATNKSTTTTTELIDNEVPIINLNKVPLKFIYGSKFDLPSYYKFGPKGGKVKCIVDGENEETDTSSLGIGKHTIVCTAYGNNGINVRVSKMVEVEVSEGEEEEWDGWIRLNLNYPANSTNWQWRIGKDGEIRDGYDFTGWQDYTGPILVKLDDVKDVYIRYDLLGETYVIAPSGKVAVDIEPKKYSVKAGEKTKVKIYYEKDALTKEYRVGSSDWMEYTEEFEVEANTLIEARSTKEEKVYNSDGEYLYSKKVKGTDSVFISEYIDGSTYNPSDGSHTGSSDGGYTGSFDYSPVQRPDGSYTTKPSEDVKPSEYLEGPIISANPSTTITENVKITITPKEEAYKIYYSLDAKTYKEYTEEFEITSNGWIRAYYIRKSDGKVSELSYYYVQNIKVGNKPYVRIDTNPNYLTNNVSEVIVKISGSNYTKLQYSFDGYIYNDYVQEIKVTKSSTIYAKGINEYGQTVETAYVTTINAPTPKKNLSIQIFTDPAASSKLINKTKVSIDYDMSAEKKYYRLADETEYQEYTGPFEITKNTTVYAYATSKDGYGYASKGIDYLTTGIMAPIITVEPSSNASMVKVSIQFDKNANQKYYQIDNGDKLYYTGEFEIYENSTIYAYNSNILGDEADATKEITNVDRKLRYYVIDKGKYFIIKLNYPSGSTVREYKWKVDGTWKTYEDIGILLIKPEYKDEFNLDGYDGIKVQDENGKDVIFTDHYYLIDVPFSELMENLFMRWDKTKPAAPEIMIEPDEDSVKEVKVIINYSKTLEKKYYKLVNEGGQSTDWLEYTGPFNVSKNGVIVYAKGETYTKIESGISSRKITNIDNMPPNISVEGDFATPKQKLNLLVTVKDNFVVDKIKYSVGLKSAEYFKNNGTKLSNPGKITIEGNGQYTIYAVDSLGNESIKVIEVTNIDKDAPSIEINVEATTKTVETKVTIDYGDSKTELYKVGENGEYKEYSGEFIIKSKDLFNLKNEDGSLTIYAKGIDEAGNEIEVKEVTYVLDLDEIKAPVLDLSDGYPMLTRSGMIEEKPSYIGYDSKDDIENIYKIDDGDYLNYEGPISIKTGTIVARSERKSSGQVVETTGTIKVPTNAVGKNTYDGDLTTSETIAKNANKTFTVNPSLYGEKLKIYTGNSVSSTSTIKLYDKDKKLLSTTSTVGVLTIVEITDDTYFVEINAGSQNLEVREIELQGSRSTSSEYVPIISINEGDWAAEKIATIKYYNEEYTNEYSIDNGATWNKYTGPIKLIEPTNVIARVIREDKVIGSSNFVVTKIDPTEPVIELELGNRIQLGYDRELPTYYKETPSGVTVECKDGEKVVTNTKDLEEGEHTIVCTAITGAKKKATVRKTIKVIQIADIESDSILEAISKEDIPTGRYSIKVNNEVYPVHMITLDGNQHFTENKTFGDANDVATASTYAQNMVIVKVNGDLTVDEGVTVAPYYDKNYGGPKGFTLYVTGKLTNKGTIDNSHGAKAEGQNVYLWKNTDGSYEYVPAEGAAGGGTRESLSSAGISGMSAQSRQTGGGGGGQAQGSYIGTSGSGSAGTSYSGGTGGGGASSSRASAGKTNGAQGGNGAGYTRVSSNIAGSGAGNPAGGCASSPCVIGKNGTGGLLIIYANEYKNNGKISSNGSSGGITSASGGSSGGGSINIFTNQNIGIDQLGIITDTKYDELKGNISTVGGSSGSGGHGGQGGLNIGEIRNGQYYDLKEIIEQDKEQYIKDVTIEGDSILSIINNNNLKSGYYYFVANGEKYPVHMITLDGNQHFTENKTFGDANDVATASTYAQNMVIVKVNGDLTVDEGVTVAPYYDKNYGGPKGFTLYVTGKLTNKGTIDNSHGAKAEGQNVYLWKNTDGSYEYVPAEGAAGGGTRESLSSAGISGMSAQSRQTGGGGGGQAQGSYIGTSGSGSAGTSYSGGTGGGGASSSRASAGKTNGAQGGNGAGYTRVSSNIAGSGAGNPAGGCASSPCVIGKNGTGGLLIIYANEYENKGIISVKGTNGGFGTASGGSSGGGSLNIFSMLLNESGNANASGGKIGNGGAGGNGTVTYTQLQPVSFTFDYVYQNVTLNSVESDNIIITINYSSTVSKKLYSLDNGANWLEYKGSFNVDAGSVVLAKGIKTDNTETDVVTYNVPTSSAIPNNAIDGDKSTSATLEANKDYVFTVSEDTIGKNLRFYLGSEPSSDATIKIYDKNNTELLSTTFVNNLTVINIPTNAYKFIINVGSKELTINEINIRKELEKNETIPSISINDVNWTSSKTIEITYPEGYKNEYSLDLGTTWNEYTEPITINEETTIFARIVKDEKVVGSSGYVVTTVDSFEPVVEINSVSKIGKGIDYEIPYTYKVGKSGVKETSCKINDIEITNTSTLDIGKYEIQCSVTSNTGMSKTVKKEIEVFEITKDLISNFDYTGGEQTYTVSKSGLYLIETWGAQGGTGNGNSSSGGVGSYSKGTLELSLSDILYINVGGQSILSSEGYNGGGAGQKVAGSVSNPGGGGGGATHISFKTGLLSTLENYKNDIIIVSGGGGGAGENSGRPGGSGGGFKGVNGIGNCYTPTGGTQVAAGARGDTDATQALFGRGGSAPNGNSTSGTYGAGGGGGGFYGGGAASFRSGSGCASSGAGGSGYIGNTLLKNKSMYCYNCEESSEESTKTIKTTNVSETPTSKYAKIGNGYARITYIGE